jgi:NADPH:quinone reductase-like Zn-dependent oxidoreductase
VRCVSVWQVCCGWTCAALYVSAGAFAVALWSWLTAPKAFNPKGKVVFITGGSSGIGLATAKIILKQGGSVALVARKAELLERA